jgi:hypothetical protein
VEIDLPGTRDEIVLRNRYETLSTANDLLIALWFLIGSILFFRESTTYAGTWLFTIGSAQLAVRPAIRIARRVHLQRRSSRPTESEDDF